MAVFRRFFQFLFFLIIPLSLIFILGGCGNDISYSDETRDLVAEYAAGQILKNNPGYRDGLKDEKVSSDAVSSDGASTTEAAGRDGDSSETVSSAASTESDSASADSTSGDARTPDTTADLSVLYEKYNLSVVYTGFSFVKKYDDDDPITSTVTPDDGDRILEVDFDIASTESGDNKVNLIDKNYTYTLGTADGKRYDPMLTLLSDDLSTCKETMKGGEKKKAVLLFEVPADLKKETGLTVDIWDGTQTLSVNLN